MVENFGILRARMWATRLKALGFKMGTWRIRKHGLRFGQFTIFLAFACLKPAPTRLRLVLVGTITKGF